MNSANLPCDVTVVIPLPEAVPFEDDRIARVRDALKELAVRFEILIVTQSTDADLVRTAQTNEAKVLTPASSGYGAALLEGFARASGEFILVMDIDQHEPARFLKEMWEARASADIVIASRYTEGGRAHMSLLRLILSRVLNLVFSRGLDLHVRDMSNGFRLYKASLVKKISLVCADYDILQEILVTALMEGYQIREIPFEYHAPGRDAVFTRVIRFGAAYVKTFSRLWRLRNSIMSADYDARAYHSLVPPQRYWQRQRYKHITGMLAGQGRCLDVGCGSSRIIGKLPPGSVAVDILMRKLRYAKKYDQMRAQASLFTLPVESASFPCVLCSQVIEHIPREGALEELDRVLQPGGLLILGTPDYAKWQWNVIEWLYKVILPQAYADEHITHYTYEELVNEFVNNRGYRLTAVHYILQGELILGLEKPAR